MLLIRRQQMEVFEHQLREDFQQRLYAHLQALFPWLEGQSLRIRMDQAVGTAGQFSIKRECDVVQYAELFCRFAGPDMDEPFPKPALNILYSYAVEAPERLTQLRQWLEENNPPGVA